jgi:hypothetical protein
MVRGKFALRDGWLVDSAVGASQYISRTLS